MAQNIVQLCVSIKILPRIYKKLNLPSNDMPISKIGDPQFLPTNLEKNMKSGKLLYGTPGMLIVYIYVTATKKE